MTLLLAWALLLVVAFVRGAPKFDPAKYVRASLRKPLGLSLEEVQQDAARGVMISDINDGGSAKAAGAVGAALKNKFLVSVNDIDVRYKSFDEVIDVIGSADADKPVNLACIAPDDVFKGPAVLTVTSPEGKSVTIKTVKGLTLRDVLLSSGVDLYPSSSRLTNCAGALQCGTCAVDITAGDEDWEPRSELEAKRLKKFKPSCRLSCATVVEGDAAVAVRPAKTA